MPVRFNCVYFLQSRHHSAAARRSFPHKHKNSLTHKLLISFLSLRRFSLDWCSAAAGETQHVLHIKRRRRVMKEKTRGWRFILGETSIRTKLTRGRMRCRWRSTGERTEWRKELIGREDEGGRWWRWCSAGEEGKQTPENLQTAAHALSLHRCEIFHVCKKECRVQFIKTAGKQTVFKWTREYLK